MSETSGTLVACPFCNENHSAEVGDNAEEGRSYVYCKACGAQGPVCLDKMEAIQRWNDVAAVYWQPIEGEE